MFSVCIRCSFESDVLIGFGDEERRIIKSEKVLIYFWDQEKTARRGALACNLHTTLTKDDDDGVGGFERRQHCTVNY